jgi:hypothetical protein
MSPLSAFKHSTVALALLSSVMPLYAQSADLPPGAMQDKVRTACTECHDSGIIRQQRLSSKAWAKEVDKMTKWGALVDPADRSAFIDYLSINFPVDKPVETADRVGQTKKK